MALREEVILDIRAALRQLDELQSQLSGFNTPITIPVEVRGEEALADLRRQADAADTTVDIDVDTFGLEQADQVFEEITGEAQELRGELSQVQSRADRLGDELDDMGGRGASAFGRLRSSLGPLIATIGAGIGIRELVGQLNAAVQAASDLNESVNAVNVIFGSSANQILAFGETAAQSVGLANAEFNQLTTTTGQLLQGLGLDAAEAARQTIVLAERSADLASVLNTDVADSLGAVNAALRGETEPIRRFIGDFSQASVQAQAVADGLAQVGEELTPTQRALASINLILEQSDRVAGDFSNTSDQLANRQRILRGELIDSQAVIGEELTGAYESLLEAAEDIPGILEDIAPAIGLIAEQAVAAVTSIEPFVALLGEIGAIGGDIADEEGTVGFFDRARESVEGFFEATTGGSLSRFQEIAGAITGIIQELRGEVSDTQLEGFFELLATRAEAGVEPVEALSEAFDVLGTRTDAVALLEDVAEAVGASDQELARFAQGLLLSAGRLGLTTDQIRALRELLLGLDAAIPEGGALVGFAASVDTATFSLEQFRDAQINAFSQTEADRVLRETFGDLPVIISDLDELQQAAADAGQSVTDFLLNVPENVTINVDPAVESIGRLLDTLAEVSAVLEETTTAGFGDIEIPELEFDAEGAVTNLDEVVDEILSQLGETAAFEANLSELIVDADAVDVAALLTTLDSEVAGALAQAFVLDDAQASELQAALDGSLEGLAPGAAEQLAATLEGAVPEQIAALGVFAADNFVSNQIRGQIAQSASEIAQVLERALDGTVISPALILDLSNVQIQGVIDTGSIAVGDGFTDTPGGGGGTGGGRGGGGGVQPTANFEVNINNPTTQNVETSATQAAQTIQAVASSLVRVD